MTNIIFLGLSIGYICVFMLIGVITLFDKLIIEKSSRVILSVFLTIALSIIAYYSTDGNTDTSGWDLNRYYANIDTMRNLSIIDAYNIGLYKTAPITNLLFVFVSRLPNNYFLQVIGTFIAMSILMYIINDIADREQYEFKIIFIMILFIFAMVGISAILLGVRNINAVMFFTLAIYIESKNNNKFTVRSSICYLIAIGFHVEAIFFIFVRILTIGKFSFVKYMLLFWSLIVPYVLSLFAYRSEYLSYIYDKLLVYKDISFYDYRVFIVYIIVVGLTGFVLYKNCDTSQIGLMQSKNANIVKTNMLYACIGSIMIYDVFSRTRMLCMLISIPEYLKCLKKDKQKLLTLLILFLTSGMIAYQLVFMKTYWRFRI